jgi:hypothetical protein
VLFPRNEHSSPQHDADCQYTQVYDDECVHECLRDFKPIVPRMTINMSIPARKMLRRLNIDFIFLVPSHICMRQQLWRDPIKAKVH